MRTLTTISLGATTSTAPASYGKTFVPVDGKDILIVGCLRGKATPKEIAKDGELAEKLTTEIEQQFWFLDNFGGKIDVVFWNGRRSCTIPVEINKGVIYQETASIPSIVNDIGALIPFSPATPFSCSFCTRKRRRRDLVPCVSMFAALQWHWALLCADGGHNGSKNGGGAEEETKKSLSWCGMAWRKYLYRETIVAQLPKPVHTHLIIRSSILVPPEILTERNVCHHCALSLATSIYCIPLADYTVDVTLSTINTTRYFCKPECATEFLRCVAYDMRVAYVRSTMA